MSLDVFLFKWAQPKFRFKILIYVKSYPYLCQKKNLWEVDSPIDQEVLTLFWTGGTSGFFLNTAQKPFGLGSWNFVTFSFNI